MCVILRILTLHKLKTKTFNITIINWIVRDYIGNIQNRETISVKSNGLPLEDKDPFFLIKNHNLPWKVRVTSLRKNQYQEYYVKIVIKLYENGFVKVTYSSSRRGGRFLPSKKNPKKMKYF